MAEANLTPLIDALSGLVYTLQNQNRPSTSKSVKEVLQTQALSFEPFDEDNENFDSYSQRLDNFFNLKGLTEDDNDTNEAKVMMLINCLGSKYYKLLSKLTSPELPASKTYTELMKLLKNHLAPKKNVLSQQHRFFSRIQTQGESIADYVAELKDLVKDCEFKAECNNAKCSQSMLDMLLRAQFIRGLLDATTRERILQLTNVSFEKAKEIAISIEISRKENREVYHSSSSGPATINAVNSQLQQKMSNTNKKHYFDQQGTKYRKNTNLKKLGLTGLCLHCGRNNHSTQNCFSAENLQCKRCHKKGHIDKVCITSLMRQSKLINSIDHNSETSGDEYSINQVIDVYASTASVFEPKMYVQVQIQNKPCSFECDTGSPVSIISKNDFEALNLNITIQKTNVCFRSYTQHIFKPLGVINVPVTYNNKNVLADLYIVPEYGSPIIGRRWIRSLQIYVHNISLINTNQTVISKIFEQFQDVFSPEVGKVPDFQCSLQLRPDAKPIYLKPRRVPYALQEEVERELDTLEKENIITKIDHSAWGTPLVIVKKKNGKIRLCADYKVTVNNQLLENRYPIPRIEDIFNKMKNGAYFCTLDIFKAYLHIPVDDTTSKIQAISTHRGTYLANRLFFGIKTAPNEFHKIIDQIIQNLDGTTVYFDDILVQGSTVEECKSRLITVLEKLRKYNLHLNKEKCRFFENEIRYLGHTISARGLQKSDDKIKAVQNAPRPQSPEGVQQFLGLIMYYTKFIPNASTLLYPLNRLLRKDVPFKWTNACEEAFKRAKEEIASERVLMPFTPELEVVLATDASPYGLSGILSHRLADGAERPVAFISRSLTRTEQNYSQLDKEATAIYWSFKKLFHYLYGRKFTLIVDNKPLTLILNPQKQLPTLSATRMIRYAQYLSGFDYNIEYRNTKDHLNVDYLSRNPLKLSPDAENYTDDTYISNIELLHKISTDTVTSFEIANEIENDPELSKLKLEVLNGTIRDPELSLQDGILFRGNRVIIPKVLRPNILRELHSTHIGIVKMKALARNYCYWKNIDSDIEKMVKSCLPCCNVKKNPAKAPLHHWEVPERNWQRVHIDFAGPFLNHHFLLVVDAKSKWPEIMMLKCSPTTSKTIYLLREIFSRMGLPEILVSDNSSLFKSKEFIEFCQRNCIKQRFIAPGHPATNGQAERYCQTLKTKLKCMMNEPGDLQEKLCSFLFRYRVTPLSSGKSPSENLFGRNLRTKLDCIRPQTDQKNMSEQPDFGKSYKLGDRVQSRNYSNSGKWKYGTIIERLGILYYLVKLDDGYTVKRHYDQIQPCQIENPYNSTVETIPFTLNETIASSSNRENKSKTIKTNDITLPHNYELISETDSPTHVNRPTQNEDIRLSNSSSTENPIFDAANLEHHQQNTELRRSARIRKPVERLGF